ncbi:MAG TPA: adenylate/guanylate cyclase domain-containing protein [Nocardioides sp.]|nr:adenylate/guanylate cyclase domain-containing protein [Nocardioides sp.]
MTPPADEVPGVEPEQSDLAGVLETIEGFLLGDAPSLTRVEVAERAGVPLEVAEQLWRLLGFPNQTDDAVAFTEADVTALTMTQDLMRMGILSPDSQSALVRTWGRSFARLAEWETNLLADVAMSAPDPQAGLAQVAASVLPHVESLQTYIWRRHLASAASRLLTVASAGSATTSLTVGFVDIVGYTSRSKNLDETELVAWLENFEDVATGIVVDHGGRIIKTIGDEVLFAADDPAAAAEIALLMTERGADDDDPFPNVRAGLAYGEVVSRLGDVFGPVVNIAARLTSVARPGAVLVDTGAYEVLSGRSDTGDDEADTDGESDGSPYRFRRTRRTPVKGYSRLQPWVLRRAR